KTRKRGGFQKSRGYLFGVVFWWLNRILLILKKAENHDICPLKRVVCKKFFLSDTKIVIC
ncbi:hypothetical protein DRQ26_06535, partial [bacterium]